MPQCKPQTKTNLFGETNQPRRQPAEGETVPQFPE